MERIDRLIVHIDGIQIHAGQVLESQQLFSCFRSLASSPIVPQPRSRDDLLLDYSQTPHAGQAASLRLCIREPALVRQAGVERWTQQGHYSRWQPLMQLLPLPCRDAVATMHCRCSWGRVSWQRTSLCKSLAISRVGVSDQEGEGSILEVLLPRHAHQKALLLACIPSQLLRLMRDTKQCWSS